MRARVFYHRIVVTNDRFGVGAQPWVGHAFEPGMSDGVLQIRALGVHDAVHSGWSGPP